MDLEIPVKVTGVPSNVHFLSQLPDTLTVSVSAQGTAFIKMLFMPDPKLELRFSDYSNGGEQFHVDNAQLMRVMNKNFSSAITIKSVLPGEISAKYTDIPGKLVPLVVEHDIEAGPFHAIGDVTLSQDSVLVYGDSKTLKSVTEAYCYFKESGLTETIVRKVTVESIKGAVVEPRFIEATIPVEKVMKMKMKVPISVRNAPENVNVVIIPSKVDVSFRVPLSKYNSNNIVITAVVDYNSIDVNTPGNKVKLQLGERPAIFNDNDIHMSLDSVEYIIERMP